jgi:23S rRNA (pseudouridine1915-N3)-methyltransferase
MKTILLQVGKTANKHIQALLDDYQERISHYLPFELITIPELRNTKNLTPQQQKQAEGEFIMRQLQPADHVVLLDEHGLQLRSLQLAQWLERKQSTLRRLVFVIGGPYGFSPDVYQRAQEQLSLSSLTFSHQMVRLVFTEQLYRACTIIKGEPYHHE